MKFSLTDEPQAAGSGVRTAVVEHCWQYLMEGSPALLMPTELAFDAISSAEPVNYHWPAEKLSEVQQQKLVRLSQLIILGTVWKIGAPFRLPHAVIYSILYGPVEAKKHLQPHHLKEYSPAMWQAVSKLSSAYAHDFASVLEVSGLVDYFGDSVATPDNLAELVKDLMG